MNTHLLPPLLLTYFHRIPHHPSDTFVFVHSSSEPIAIVSNPSPLPAHVYITHHAHRSLFSLFCFISNRIFFVIPPDIFFPPPSGVTCSRLRTPVLCIQRGSLLWFCPSYPSHFSQPQPYASGVLYVSFAPCSHCFVHKVSQYYDCLYCIPTFLPTKIISYAIVVATSFDPESHCKR